MDYVYICRSGDNEELRYSLRSVVKNATFDKVWLIGNKPDWYIGNYIEVDNVGDKFSNITNCYKTLPLIGALSEDFILMNDDFFILKPLGKMPTLYDDSLKDKIDKHISAHGRSRYVRILIQAKKHLEQMGIAEPLSYDLHVPMQFNKTKLAEMEHINDAPRSMYGNIYNIGGSKIDDVKIYKKDSQIDIGDSHFISTADNSFNLIKDKLKELFPDKTIFEKE